MDNVVFLGVWVCETLCSQRRKLYAPYILAPLLLLGRRRGWGMRRCGPSEISATCFASKQSHRSSFNCGAVAFESHGWNPWSALYALPESRKATAFSRKLLGQMVNISFRRENDSHPMPLLQSSDSIGAYDLEFRSRCELYPRLKNSIAFAIQSQKVRKTRKTCD